MATKTFKIGEYAKGGIITVETTTRTVVVIGKDWDMSQGTSRGSNQSNAKEFDRETVSLDDTEARRKLSNFLNDLTSKECIVFSHLSISESTAVKRSFSYSAATSL